MPTGKAPGARCIQLDAQNRCLLFDQPSRPAVCRSFTAEANTCGSSREEAMSILAELETLTSA